MKDNTPLYRTFESVNSWRTWNCGCVANENGFVIRYCGPCNPKQGTHWGKLS